MPDLLYDRMMFSGLDVALVRFKAFADAHQDFEPSLTCERTKDGRRRWALTIVRRTADEARFQRRGNGDDE